MRTFLTRFVRIADLREPLELVHLRQDNAGAALPAEAVGAAGEQPQAAQQGPLQRARKGTDFSMPSAWMLLLTELVEKFKFLSLAMFGFLVNVLV